MLIAIIVLNGEALNLQINIKKLAILNFPNIIIGKINYDGRK